MSFVGLTLFLPLKMEVDKEVYEKEWTDSSS